MNERVSSEELDNLYAENAQLKASLAQKEVIYIEKGEQILRELEQYKRKIEQLNNNIENLEISLEHKNHQIDKVKLENKHLEEKIILFSKPIPNNIDPVIIKKVEFSAPQVQTIYVDRPLPKTQLVEVEKVVRHFVQPERPIINRIIECEGAKPRR